MNPDWRDDAGCRGLTNVMFPTTKRWGHDPDYHFAQAVCRRCTVVEECLEDAIRSEPMKARQGMRAGLTPNQRDRVARARRAVAS